MARKYQLNKREQRKQETRQRITEATIELHKSVGASGATISAIAEKAGVERLTVYRHFPDERALFSACTSHYFSMNPPPDLEPWKRISDPEIRLRIALAEVYAFYRRNEPIMSNAQIDVARKPVLGEILAPFFEHWERMRDVLAKGWRARGRRRKMLLSALAHALDFQTWQSLVRRGGLEDTQAVELMVGMVQCLMGDKSALSLRFSTAPAERA